MPITLNDEYRSTGLQAVAVTTTGLAQRVADQRTLGRPVLQRCRDVPIDYEKQLTDIRADLVTHRRSIQQLEISDARNSERYQALGRSMEELKAAQRETNELLLQVTSRGGGN